MFGNNTDQPGFDILFYKNPQSMWIYNTANFKIIEVNAAALSQYGYTRNEFLSKTILELRPIEDIPAVKKILSTLQNDTPPREFRHQTKDGAIFYVEINSYSIEFGGVNARLVHSTNIQNRKTTEQALEKALSRLEKTLETINMGFCQLDNEQKISYWNPAMEELIGYNRADVMGKKLWDVLPELINTDLYNLLKWSIDEHDSIEFIEYFWPLQKWLSIASHPGEYGQTIHMRDSTSKIQFQKSLIKKIEQLKDVSYLNSHLIRKPVASLMGLTNLIKDGIIDTSEFRNVADYIYECSLELDQVVREVNDKINDDTKYESLLKDLSCFRVFNLLQEIEDEFGTDSLNKLKIVDKTDNMLYYGNRQSIKTSLGCLINNAIKYSSVGSDIILEADIIQQNLVISVQDFGVGIDSEMLNRLFLGLTHIENFKNLGSGLTLVADVVRNHNGTVWVESMRGVGSVFSLRLPLSNIAVNIATGKPDFTIYKEPVVEIYPDRDEYLIANYKGFHDKFSVKAGSKKILDTLKTNENSFSKILIDDTDLLGVWDGAVEWIANEWFPMIERAGVKHIAVVYPKSTFTKVSVDNVASKIDAKIIFKAFNQTQSAIAWLRQQPAA